MTGSPLGAILTRPPPVLTAEDAARILDDHWGLTGTLTPLASERDANVRVETAAGAFVLKLANPAEPPAETALQTAALQHLAGSLLPVPRVMPTVSGAVSVALPAGRFRLLTYLPGLPLHTAPPSDAQRAAVGTTAARLAQALRSFHHPAAERDLVWDISHTGRLRPLLRAIADPDLRRLAEAAMNRFDADLAPALPGLPRQVVHNDLNPHNLLVCPDNPDAICGILDFGDMVAAPQLLDLGIAASYQIDPDRPAESLGVVTEAYHAENPLSDEERRLVPLAVTARLVTTLCIAHERARLYPENAAYILRNVPVSAAALRAMAPAKGPR